jgi:uncharacterized damage-inducible protein DinB
MLARYKAWANARLYAALAGLAERELAAPRRIFAGSILRTLHHVYLMDTVWQAHLRGVAQPPATTRNPETTPPFAELRDAQASIDAWYADYARSLSPDLGAEVVAFDFIGGDAGAMRRDDMLLHVVTHAAYHRGHIAAVLNLLGIAPPVTDLPVFLREPGPPTA